MIRLSVNLDKVAWLRNTRDVGIPNLARSAATCMRAGAHGITIHPRPDQRHIRYSDVYELAGMLTIELNVEGNPFLGKYMEVVEAVRPTQCTLVPDAPDVPTSQRGWDPLAAEGHLLKPIVERLKRLGSRVSLFVEPESAAMPWAKAMGADRVELRTTDYAAAFQRGDVEAIFQRCRHAAAAAQELGLGVNGGHDLNLENLPKFCTIPDILEVSIGHALIADALDMGLFATIKAYLDILSQPR